MTGPGVPSGQARSESCTSCPYRKDVPSGVWAASEYEKLAAYDAPTYAQPMGRFHCHASPEHVCHGWAVVEGRKEGQDANLALRVFPLDGPLPVEHTPLWASGTEAAEHGLYDVDAPSPEAAATAERLLRKYDHLKPARRVETHQNARGRWCYTIVTPETGPMPSPYRWGSERTARLAGNADLASLLAVAAFEDGRAGALDNLLATPEEVIDAVRARNRDVHPDEIASLLEEAP